MREYKTMTHLTAALSQLDELADELAARGDATLAEKARFATIGRDPWAPQKGVLE